MSANKQRRWTMALLVAATLLATTASGSTAAPPVNDAFQQTWARTDKPVADTVVSRTWMWGPEGFTGELHEAYAESPGGQRQVQYFDKSRMEITQPDADPTSIWYVTNGLLVVELMTGNLQLGDNTFEQHQAAVVNVAGDADDTSGPTYATMSLLREVDPFEDGYVIDVRFDRQGMADEDPSLAAYGVTAAYRVTVPGIDHQIASVFWDFMNSSGTVYADGEFSEAPLFVNPYYATGYPVTEAVWANVKVAGTYKDVLLQCFERRCLTYTPGNPEGWRVEAGNVGQHYHRWRYEQIPAETYRFDLRIGGRMDSDSALTEPSGLASDADGDLYVSDAQLGQVQTFDPDGRFLDRWDGLNGPAGLTVGSDGRVWVAERDGRDVRVFAPDGSPLLTVGAPGAGRGQFLAPVDVALDSAGYVFALDAERNMVLIFGPSGAFVTEGGGSGAGPGEFNAPAAIEIDLFDRIWIADTNNSRVQAFLWDPASGPTYLGQAASPMPTAIAIDPTGHVGVVASWADNVIRTYSLVTGAAGPAFGSTGDDDGEFDGITGLATTGEALYVADSGNARVQKLGPGGVYVDQWHDDRRGRFASPVALGLHIEGDLIVVDQGLDRVVGMTVDGLYVTERGAPELRDPSDVAVDAAGNIYVVDSENDRIVKFDRNGSFVLAWGTHGPGPGQFESAVRIAVDEAGAVYVTDMALQRVQKFTSAGVYLTGWGSGGDGPGQFRAPWGIAAHGGRVYVTDVMADRVQIFDTGGTWLGEWGHSGVGPGELDTPSGITVDTGGDVYVTDIGNMRVQVFSADGEYRSEFGTIGVGDGQFYVPIDVLVTPDGAVWVVDVVRADIQRFVPLH